MARRRALERQFGRHTLELQERLQAEDQRAKQQAELVATLDLIEVLPPGLYEMIREERTLRTSPPTYTSLPRKGLREELIPTSRPNRC